MSLKDFVKHINIYRVINYIYNFPPCLIFIAFRVVFKIFHGKHFRWRLLQFVITPFIKKTEDGLLFYIRRNGDEITLCEPRYEHIVRNILQPASEEIVIDIGAHVGTYAVRLAKKSKLVIAIEPHPSNFEVLKYNVALNKISNILCINAGIGRENGYMFLEPRKVYGLTALRNTGDIVVKVYSLDALVRKLRIEKVDWIKLDTEGMELDILHGAKHILEQYNPKLVIEIHEDGKEIIDFLKQLGYLAKGIDARHILAWKNSKQEPHGLPPSRHIF